MDELTGQGKRRREGCVHVAFLDGPSTESMINLVKVLDGHDDGSRSLHGYIESGFK
jgi:hypothetical protein